MRSFAVLVMGVLGITLFSSSSPAFNSAGTEQMFLHEAAEERHPLLSNSVGDELLESPTASTFSTGGGGVSIQDNSIDQLGNADARGDAQSRFAPITFNPANGALLEGEEEPRLTNQQIMKAGAGVFVMGMGILAPMLTSIIVCCKRVHKARDAHTYKANQTCWRKRFEAWVDECESSGVPHTRSAGISISRSRTDGGDFPART